MRAACSVFLAVVVAGCARATSSPPMLQPPAAAPLSAKSPAYDTLYSFGAAPDGFSPTTKLLDLNGTLYGTTASGGYAASGPCDECGAVFSITPSGTEKVIYRFSGPPDGEAPKGNLVAADGELFGTTVYGGNINVPRCPASGKGCGVVFKVGLDGTEKVLHAFGVPRDGANPEGGLILFNGRFYGTTSRGDNQMGIVFSISRSGEEKPIYRFGGAPNDGQSPVGSLAELERKLYGVTASGGTENLGAIFELSPKDGKETLLHSFIGSDGAAPAGGLTEANGLLYGAATTQGPHGHGVIFSISRSGSYHIVHAFRGSAQGDGASPWAPPISVHGTILYGTTRGGGEHARGTIYQIDQHGRETVLHSFGRDPDGARPEAELLWLRDTLYGTTAKGGSAGLGTVFSLAVP